MSTKTRLPLKRRYKMNSLVRSIRLFCSFAVLSFLFVLRRMVPTYRVGGAVPRFCIRNGADEFRSTETKQRVRQCRLFGL